MLKLLVLALTISGIAATSLERTVDGTLVDSALTELTNGHLLDEDIHASPDAADFGSQTKEQEAPPQGENHIQKKCESWCRQNAKPWKDKCSWGTNACAACSECSLSGVLAQAQPAAKPTVEPTDYGVRLTSSKGVVEGHEGLVEVFLNGDWHPLCGHNFAARGWLNDRLEPKTMRHAGVIPDNEGATTVCKKLNRGYTAGMAVVTGEKFGKDAFDPGFCGPGQWGWGNRCSKWKECKSRQGCFPYECSAGKAIGTTVRCFTEKTLEAARTGSCPPPRGALIAQNVACAGSKLFACLNSSEKKVTTCECYGEYIEWWKQNMKAAEHDGQAFWASCFSGVMGSLCDPDLPCSADTDLNATQFETNCKQHCKARHFSLGYCIDYKGVPIPNKNGSDRAKEQMWSSNCDPENRAFRVTRQLEQKGWAIDAPRTKRCSSSKRRLPYDAASAARAGAMYQAALTDVMGKVLQQPSAIEHRAKSDGIKFASLPVGLCFGALREEIQNATACKQAAEYLRDNKKPVGQRVLDFVGEAQVKEIDTADESLEPSRCYVNLEKAVALSNGDRVLLEPRDIVFNARDSAHDAEPGKQEKICGPFVEAAETGSTVDYGGTEIIPGTENKYNLGRTQIFERDVTALNMMTHHSYWFVSRDASTQRGPYQFSKMREERSTFVGEDYIGGGPTGLGSPSAKWPFEMAVARRGRNNTAWSTRTDRATLDGVTRKHFPPVMPAAGAWTGDENPYDVCMAVSPQIRLKEFTLPTTGEPFGIGANGRRTSTGDDQDWTGRHWCAAVAGKVSVSAECREHWPDKSECPEVKGWRPREWVCDRRKMPNMQVGSFLVKKPIKHGTACKRPVEWEKWQTDPTMLTMREDLDGDNIKDYAWCLSVDGDRCSTKLRGTIQSSNGCNREENTPWIVENAPQFFVKPGECVCSCDKPRCYGGQTNALLQATSYVQNDKGLWLAQQCKMSLPGRLAMERCCEIKIEAYKKVVIDECDVPAQDISDWCNGVPDGYQVQIGGRVNQDFNHHSTNACAESHWRESWVYTKEMQGKAEQISGAEEDMQQTATVGNRCLDGASYGRRRLR